MKTLLISDGIVHPNLAARWELYRALSSIPTNQITALHSLEALRWHDPSRYDCLVLYFHHKRISPQALGLFRQYVMDGGGVLAVHSASASFKQTPEYFEILGGRFTHHGPIAPFSVEPAPGSETIFGPLPPFTITDELYRHEFDPNNTVQFWIPVGEEREPFVWTRSYGQGKICYLSAGHHASSLKNPAIRAILQRGLAWASRALQTEKLTA